MDKSDVNPESHPNIGHFTDKEIKAIIEEHIKTKKRTSLFE